MSRIAIVGLACRYPDATSPTQLWENVVAGRRAFRRIPTERMNLTDYWSADPTAPDRFYAERAAVIEGYEFDRVGYRVAGSTYRSTDLTHWLALDTAARALADAGFPDGTELPRERTGVVVGNSLTGEFTRANTMRLRWPYVRRTLAAALREEGWDDDRLTAFLADLEQRYKQPFPAIDEDTLAGGLSNTIAGRICNHFDLKGGGYTVDGACSSSLLSVATACRSLLEREVDVAIAGGVDLSIDPFEIVGFAKTGALATGEMRVYDRRSNGFWPGEGCGMVVLMREPDALAADLRTYATIAGWGISSDGKGGITRPEVAGYRLALRRAYRRAGFGVDSVPLFEGHGTGTAVGDETELRALAQARRAADPDVEPAAIGSIKAMIGHTKAAAGVAGLIKATLAAYHEVLPPTVGCVDPHPALAEGPPALRVLRSAEPWPEHRQVRAGVTAMGFGGINTHVVIENSRPQRRRSLPSPTATLARHASNDAELLVLTADEPAELRTRVAELVDYVGRLSYAELGDLAATLQADCGRRPYRVAVVATSPQQAEERLRELVGRLAELTEPILDPATGSFAGRAGRPARIGFLFPGQGSGKETGGGALRRRFAVADEVFHQAALPAGADAVATAVAQPRIAASSLAGLAVLTSLGIEASVAVGHSLGELSALHWAGCIDAPGLLRLAAIRGRVMTEHSLPGTMASIAVGPETVEPLLAGTGAVIAGYNGPRQTVVAGTEPAIKQVCARAAAAGLGWLELPVSHAFHSPLVAGSASEFAAALASVTFAPVARSVVSTVTGADLPADADLAGLLRRQITDPVRFAPAVTAAAGRADLFLEVGPGVVLSRLATSVTGLPALPVDTDSPSLAPLYGAVAAAFVAGSDVHFDVLAAGRPDRRMTVGAPLSFFASPCEQAPELGSLAERDGGSTASPAVIPTTAGEPTGDRTGDAAGDPTAGDAVEVLRGLVATRAELPPTAVGDDSRLLDDLHLSSITVGQVFGQAASELGVPAGQAPTSFATATLKELAAMLDDLRATGVAQDADPADPVPGVGTWVRPFHVALVEVAKPTSPTVEPNGPWQVHAPAGHPLAEPLRQLLAGGGVGAGVLVCLPADCQESDLELALRGAQAAVAADPGGRLVVIQHGRGAAAIAKTARLEAPRLRTTVVDTPPDPALAIQILADVAATSGYREVHYDSAGNRRVPVLRPLVPKPGEPALAAGDVLLVTGGGKGITAECALALAVEGGARLAVLGRSDPAADPELAANLARMTAAGLTVHYVRSDVTDPAAVRAAVTEVTAVLGPVTAVLHGAGGNQPAGLSSLDMAEFRRTLAPKLDGLAAVLAAVDPAALRLVVTFGSIIGRAGLRGEAHYATANDWLATATVELTRRFPGCRAVCLEWSVWSGVGMGERLSVVQSLTREGIQPITVDQGVDALRQLLADRDLPPVLVVTGRAEGVDTLAYERPPLPLLRFLERELVHYPGVELVVENTLDAATDPYLTDHLLDGNLLYPAVIGMEAMVQVATALRGTGGPLAIEQAAFLRPIVVPPGGRTAIRIAALLAAPDLVEVAIRSSETGFGADHFRAVCRFGTAPPPTDPPESVPADLPPVILDPARDLYGDVLFQTGRFQRLRRYRRVAARHAEAEVVGRTEEWFGTFLPNTVLLGDAGARDALMHGLQVCVPDATLLPAGVERIQLTGAGPEPPSELTFVATERHRDGDTYYYDIVVRDPAGATVEWWQGLRLQAVRKHDGSRSWPPALLGPFLQRRVEDLCGLSLTVVVEPELGADRRGHTALAVRRALNREPQLHYRPDGRPELAGARMSASHGAGVTLVVTGEAAVGCDVEPVVARSPEEWAGLVRPHQASAEAIAAETGELPDTVATRLWSALEALEKAGVPRTASLAAVSCPAPGWVRFDVGEFRVVTFVATIHGVDQPVVLALAAREGS